jgi:hypothetical protein
MPKHTSISAWPRKRPFRCLLLAAASAHLLSSFALAAYGQSLPSAIEPSLVVSTAADAAPDVRGIYVFSNDVGALSSPSAAKLATALGEPGVDGLVLDIGWDVLEPAKGQYQWALLDQWISTATRLGRKIDLSVLAGQRTPSWLFQAVPAGAGASPLAFTVSPHGGATGACQAVTLAAPWDAAFLARWDALLVALAAHLKSAGSYGSIALLRLTGINRTTEELRLPAETAQSTGLACVSDAIALWQQAGYRPGKLLQGWDAITSSFLKSFPDKSFSVAIIPQSAFPRIADDGSVIVGTVPDQNLPLLSLAAGRFPGRLVVQFDFLMPGEAASSAVVQAAQTLGTLAAFQTNEYFGSTGQGAGCSEPVTNPAPCTAATFLAMLQTGIYPLGQVNPLRAQYIEVFAANAIAFPDDLVQAHNALYAGPAGATPVVVEYFEPDLADFFITADPAEQAFVDGGGAGRWLRTGNTFATGGPNQVCRFYGNGAINPVTGTIYGPNSHFYTADPAECAGLKAQFSVTAKSWKFESNDFRTTPASNGACAAGLTSVYRAYNNGFAKGIDSNHRITSNYAAYLQTVAAGSIGEGVVMCAPPGPKPAGLYVDSTAFPIATANAATLAASLNVPGVDGLVLVLGWDGIEPNMGQYQWNTLDQWMTTAIAAGIKVELSLRADLAPAWVFQPAPGGAGAIPLKFTYSAQGGTKPCKSETIAAPWDPAFLNQWDSMLGAVAAHLRSTGTYNAVTLVRLTGINRDSDELHLPAQTPQSATGAACVGDAVSTWLQAGYRPSKLLQGWDGTTSAFKRNFPDKYFSVAIIATTYPFPPIADDGSVITKVQDLSTAQNLPLLTLASQKFPGQLIIQNNSLYPNVPAQNETVQSAQSLGTMIAFQTNLDFGPAGGAGCGAPGDATPTTCTASTFLQMLETGIYPLGKNNSLRAQYIEVFAANVNAFPAATLQAHGELVP